MKQLIGIVSFLLFIGTITTDAQNINMRLTETIAADSVSKEASCIYYNGELLIIGKSNGYIEFWNYRKSKTYKAHTAEITAVTLNDAGTYIASAAKDNTIKLWRIKSGEEVYSFNRDNSIIVLIKTLIFNDKLNTLISIDEYNNIQTWNTNGLMYGNDMKNTIFNKFCSVAPDEWECEVITSGFNESNTTQDTDTQILV